MNQFVKFSRYYILTITFFAYCVNYAQSKRLEDVMEQPANEKLRLADSDVIHICRVEEPPKEFCLVVSKETDGSPTSECHEFHPRDAKITFMKAMEYTKMVVFRNGAVRWNLSFTARSDHILRGLYLHLLKQQHQWKTVARPIDLWKRGSFQSDFEKIATQPFIIVDNEFENWNVVYVVSMVGRQRGPLLAIMKGKMTIFTAEDDKVYMSLRDFPLERYFFTCASPDVAERLSNFLGRYNVQGVAIPRSKNES